LTPLNNIYDNIEKRISNFLEEYVNLYRDLKESGNYDDSKIQEKFISMITFCKPLNDALNAIVNLIKKIIDILKSIISDIFDFINSIMDNDQKEADEGNKSNEDIKEKGSNFGMDILAELLKIVMIGFGADFYEDEFVEGSKSSSVWDMVIFFLPIAGLAFGYLFMKASMQVLEPSGALKSMDSFASSFFYYFILVTCLDRIIMNIINFGYENTDSLEAKLECVEILIACNVVIGMFGILTLIMGVWGSIENGIQVAALNLPFILFLTFGLLSVGISIALIILCMRSIAKLINERNSLIKQIEGEKDLQKNIMSSAS
jgi:F0F1-type ATP synthase assembly protein I